MKMRARAKNRHLAYCFLHGACKSRYTTLVAQLNKQYSRGLDQFPIDLNAAFNLLVTYVDEDKQQHKCDRDNDHDDKRNKLNKDKHYEDKKNENEVQFAFVHKVANWWTRTEMMWNVSIAAAIIMQTIAIQ